MNLEERPSLEDYKNEDRGSSSYITKTTDFTSVTTVPVPEGDDRQKQNLKSC